MKLSCFVDFYVIESLKLLCGEDKEPLLHSHERLARDIDTTYTRVSDNAAHMLSDYLWLAALGEARWAKRSACFYTPSLTNEGDSSRHVAYKKSIGYAPVEHNIKVLETIFFDRWYSGAYGGTPWGLIARCARLYKTVPSNVFVDTVASIRHNGGLAFNKSEASSFIDMNFDIEGSSLSRLLEIKMRSRNPGDLFDGFLDGYGLYKYMSYGTMSLLLRYNTLLNVPGEKARSTIIAICAKKIAYETYEDTLDYTPVKWGSKLLLPVEKVYGRRSYADDTKPCQGCGVSTNIDDLNKYNNKMFCLKCINVLGIAKCWICGLFKDRNVIHKCGNCSGNHCDNCRSECTMCGSYSCNLCVYTCSTCNFKGCKNCYRAEHNVECYYCGNITCNNGPKPNKMKCGATVCAAHYERHMLRCEICNPPVCVTCGETAGNKCKYCSRYVCAICLVRCVRCVTISCKDCADNQCYVVCDTCDNTFCGHCAEISCSKKLCDASLACNTCYKQHYITCTNCHTSHLCLYGECTNEAKPCKCGKYGECTSHGYVCTVCNAYVCDACSVTCRHCSNTIHATCAFKSKCGATMCSTTCAKKHNMHCKAATQTCSCGNTYKHTALLNTCGKCNANICSYCGTRCTECGLLLCRTCSKHMLFAQCHTLVCSEACVEKHNAECAVNKISSSSSIPEFIEVDGDESIKTIESHSIFADIIATPVFDVIVKKPKLHINSTDSSSINIDEYVAAVKKHMEKNHV